MEQRLKNVIYANSCLLTDTQGNSVLASEHHTIMNPWKYSINNWSSSMEITGRSTICRARSHLILGCWFLVFVFFYFLMLCCLILSTGQMYENKSGWSHCKWTVTPGNPYLQCLPDIIGSVFVLVIILLKDLYNILVIADIAVFSTSHSINTVLNRFIWLT